MNQSLAIPLMYREQVDSTSSECQRLLASAEQSAPFAVWTRHQSEGRGRRGHTWSSPEGNLYLSIVLPTPQAASSEIALWPMKAAQLLCWWVATKFDVRLTMKWPNDLYFAGAKLGGVLCETAVRGSQWSDVVIGIGLNVNLAPEVGDVSTISLKDVVGRSDDVERLAYSITKFFEKHWPKYSNEDVVSDYHHFGIEVGQRWRREGVSRDVCRLFNVTPKGALQLQSVTDPARVEELYASTDEYRWIYRRDLLEQSSLLIADVGNTALKLSYFAHASDDTPTKVLNYSLHQDSVDLDEMLVKDLRFLLEDEQDSIAIHYLSVNPSALDRVRSITGDVVTWVEIPRRPLRYRGAYAMLEMGMDRFSIIEALIQQRSGRPTLALSLGTATTVALINDHGVHLGGWILPGLQMSLQALGDGTSNLPTPELGDVAVSAASIEWGLGTRSAMTNGCVQALMCMVQGLRASLSAELKIESEAIRVVMTGGNAWRLAGYSDWEEHPYLIAQGARLMVLGGQAF